jgi:competence protein ComEC
VLASLAGACPRPLPALEGAATLALALGAWRARHRWRRVACAAAFAAAAHCVQDAVHARVELRRRAVEAVMARSGSCDLSGSIRESWPLAAGGSAARLRVQRIECAGAVWRGNAEVRLTLVGLAPPPLPGERIEAHARLHPPAPAGNPGASDVAALLRARGVVALGSVKSPRLVRRVRTPALRLAATEPLAVLGRWRLVACARIEEAIKRGRQAHPATAPLLAALLLGQRETFDAEALRALQASGLYHLVAISGLHVVLLGWGLARGLRWLGAGALASAATSAGVLCGYVLLAGAPASAQRALAMLALWEAGRLSGRRGGARAAVAVSAALLLTALPRLRLDPGFWLSVGGAAAIVAAADRPGAGAHRASRPPHEWLRRGARASWAAYLAVAPLQALWFQRWTPLGIVLNLAAVPLSSLLLGAALAAAAAGGSSAAAPVALVSDLGVRALMMLTLPRVCDGEVFRIPAPAAAVCAAHLASTAALVWRLPAARPWRCLLAGAHLALILPASSAPSGGLSFTLWNVGQGESGLVRLPDGEALVIDAAGRSLSGPSAMEQRILPALRQERVRRVLALALSHLDRDHSAGAEEAVAALLPREIWISSAAAAGPRSEPVRHLAALHGARLRTLSRGASARIGGARVEVLWPPAGEATRKRENPGSLVLRISAGTPALLLTGDLDGRAEARLAALAPAPAEVLKVGHHGSRSSSGEAFLAAVRPRLALISAGPANPWGHPHPETLARLRRAGARVFATSAGGGALRVVLRGGRGLLERWSAGRWRGCAVVSGRGKDLADRHRDERQREQDQGRRQERGPRAPERLPVHDGRMTIADDEEQDGPSQPGRDILDSRQCQPRPPLESPPGLEQEIQQKGQQRPARGARNESVQPPRPGVEEMTAVELSDREQVQTGGQLPQPAGQEHRPHPQVLGGGGASPAPPRQRAHQQRVSELDGGLLRLHLPGLSGEDAVGQGGNEQREAGQRPGDGDVEQRPPGRNRRADADEGSERAEQERRGQKVGPGGFDAVRAAGEEMPQLVRAEDRQNGERVSRPVPEAPTRLDGGGDGGEKERRGKPAAHVRADPMARFVEGGQRLRRFFPGLKRIVLPGGILTSVPVRGLRPSPFLRGLTWKTPKPRSSIRSPRRIDSFIASRTASTAMTALTRVMSAILETSLMISALIIARNLLAPPARPERRDYRAGAASGQAPGGLLLLHLHKIR